ncbi:MAG TPA: hypothetical protein VLB01_08435 [Thermodesulfobacteriota bacterium]|nr:hypothetical protein [Thermodesulfobacteriota bacterium]
MLSSLLRLLQKVGGDKVLNIELSPELKTSLAFIESGCLAIWIDSNAGFVFKGTRNEINSLKQYEHVNLGFECIKRPEFPSVRMYFELMNRDNKAQSFDYLFGIESDEDMELLRSLKGQGYFDILFSDSDKIRYSRRIRIKEEERKALGAILDEAVS